MRVMRVAPRPVAHAGDANMNIRMLAALLLTLVGPQAFAATLFTATMAGTNEVPANGSTATGSRR